MKLLELDIELSNKDYYELLNIYTKEELENHFKKYIKDTLLMEKKKQKILDEAERVFTELKKL